MKKFIDFYDIVLNKITYFVAVVAGILFFLPAVMVFYEVVMRGVFNAPTEWSIELSVYCVLIGGFLGMPVTYSAGKHISVDIVTAHFSAKTRCYVELGTSIIGVFFCLVFFIEALDMTLLSLEIDRTSPDTLRMPLWIPQMSMPIGVGLLMLHFLRTALSNTYKITSKDFLGGRK